MPKSDPTSSKTNWHEKTRHRFTRIKRRHSADDEMDEVLPKWKLALVGAAIFVCFAMLYPSVFSPIINSLLGKGTLPPTKQPSGMPPGAANRPHLREMGSVPRPPHSVHPGMRMQQQVETPQSGGRGGGLFTMMLPVHTVGVVGFLIYTLFKVGNFIYTLKI